MQHSFWLEYKNSILGAVIRLEFSVLADKQAREWKCGRYTGAGLTVVERIYGVDHELQQAMPKFGMTGMRMTSMPAWLITAVAATTTSSVSADATATAAASAVSDVSGTAAAWFNCHGHAATSARTRSTAHTCFAAIRCIGMLLKQIIPICKFFNLSFFSIFFYLCNHLEFSDPFLFSSFLQRSFWL